MAHTTERNIDHELLSASLILYYVPNNLANPYNIDCIILINIKSRLYLRGGRGGRLPPLTSRKFSCDMALL